MLVLKTVLVTRNISSSHHSSKGVEHLLQTRRDLSKWEQFIKENICFQGELISLIAFLKGSFQ